MLEYNLTRTAFCGLELWRCGILPDSLPHCVFCISAQPPQINRPWFVRVERLDLADQRVIQVWLKCVLNQNNHLSRHILEA